MVDRPFASRVATMLLAALFLLSGEREAFGVGQCPHHDGPLPGAHAPAAAPHTAGHVDVHAPRAADGSGASHAPGACTCMGACEAGPSIPVPAGLGAIDPAPSAFFEHPSLADNRTVLPGPDPFELPFANAPPAGR